MNIKCWLSGLFVLTASTLWGMGEKEAPPNIIFLMTDDQRWDNFGCYGRPEFSTKHIDQLAEQGVIFDKAYYAVAICMPSRATMFTGRHISSHQVGFTYPYNFTLSDEDFAQSYPAMLKEAGYRTGFVGKLGVAKSKKGQRPSAPKTYDIKEHYQDSFDYFYGNGVHFSREFRVWPAEDEKLQDILKINTRTDGGRTVKTGKAMLHFLETQPKDQPFCLSVSFYAVKNDSDRDMFKPHVEVFKEKVLTVPENWVEGDNQKLPEVVQKNWRGVPLHRARTSTPEKYQKLARRFATQGYSVDQQVGLLMEALKEKGFLDNTVVIYTSDNGRFHGSHGLYDKAILYDESAKAPLIVFDGRLPEEKRGRREDALISSVDIAPTILSLAGVEAPPKMEGGDFSSLLDQSKKMENWRDAILMESLFLSKMHGHRNQPTEVQDQINQKMIKGNQSYRCRGVRTNSWKYFIYYEHDPVIEELYHMEEDPFELNNLAADPESEKMLVELRMRTEELHAEVVK